MPKRKKTEKAVMIEKERYNRQKRIWGDEGQEMLTQSRAAIVGLDKQGLWTAACAIPLGIGHLVLIDGSDVEKGEMFLGQEVPVGPRAESYAALLGALNPQVKIESYVTQLESSADDDLLGDASVIVDATNSLNSKRRAMAKGHDMDVPVLSTSSVFGYTKLMQTNGEKDPAGLMPMFEGKSQDELMALLMCGVTTEEMRKVIFKEEGKYLGKPVRYRLGEGYRFGFPKSFKDIPTPDWDIYAKIQAVILGFGAIGNWAGIPGSYMNFKCLDLVDYDIFDTTNPHRQILGIDGIGEKKCVHGAKKIKAMSRGRTKSKGIDQMIEPGFTTKKKYQLGFDLVDNPYTRAVNTAWALENGAHLISAGAMPYSARVITQSPGKTQCMNCIYDIFEQGKQAEMIRRASCVDNPDPSVVMPNAISGAMAMLASFSLFEPEKFGEPFNGEVTYRAEGPTRFGTDPLNDPCDCYSKPVPNLKITQKMVDKFVKKNPHLLRQQQ